MPERPPPPNLISDSPQNPAPLYLLPHILHWNPPSVCKNARLTSVFSRCCRMQVALHTLRTTRPTPQVSFRAFCFKQSMPAWSVETPTCSSVPASYVLRRVYGQTTAAMHGMSTHTHPYRTVEALLFPIPWRDSLPYRTLVARVHPTPMHEYTPKLINIDGGRVSSPLSTGAKLVPVLRQSRKVCRKQHQALLAVVSKFKPSLRMAGGFPQRRPIEPARALTCIR